MIDTKPSPLTTDELAVMIGGFLTGCEVPVRSQIADGIGPSALTEAQLDHVTAAGSKPGMVGDGRRPQ